jgi:pilus assembly protein CpaC
LHLLVGRSLVVTSPTRIKRVSLADPNVIDALVVNPSQVLINGKAPGSVSLVLWDEAGQSQAFDVSVDLDIHTLTERIHQAFPDQTVQVQADKDVVMLSGQVGSTAVADKMLEMAKATSPRTVSLLEVPPAISNGEILLAVKFAEVDRQAITQLGLNIVSLPGAKNIGSISTQQFAPPFLQGGGIGANNGGFTLSDLLNIFYFRPDINLALTIKALQEKNLLQILAEPNVLAKSGKEANFLAGGEFPFPVVQASSAGAIPVVTIQFKEFGIKLDFLPTLMPDGSIHLKVRPEVSALDFSNSLTISGFTIPALSTRRVESEMDLNDGQSFAIAGLVDNRVTRQLSKVPGLGDIPLLGKIFQSVNLNKSNSELLVLVTPRIVKPLAPGEKVKEPYFPQPFLPPTEGLKPGPSGQ